MRCIWTFLEVPIPVVLIDITTFYMSSSVYDIVKLRETVLGLLCGILEKKIDVKPLLES